MRQRALACLLRHGDKNYARITMLGTRLPVVLIAGAPRTSLAGALGEHRYTIAQAHMGTRALEWARDLHPDVIVLEADLPDISGIEVCRRLRADSQVSSSVPILLLWADEPSPEQRVTGSRAGAWGCMRSPPDPAELAPRLDAYIEAKQHLEVTSAQGLIDRATGLHNRLGLVRRAREFGALMNRTHGSLACIVFELEPEPTTVAIAHVVKENTRASDAVGTLEPTALAVFAPATAGDGAAKLAGRVGAILRDAGARVGYDAATNLTYAPMDPLELLARARAAIRQGRPDPAYPWLRSFAGTTPRTSGGVLVPGDARTEQ